MEQQRRSQQKRLDNPQFRWKDHVVIHNLPAPLKTEYLDMGKLISQHLRNSSHQQDNRYKLEDSESGEFCREGSELHRSWTGKSLHVL